MYIERFEACLETKLRMYNPIYCENYSGLKRDCKIVGKQRNDLNIGILGIRETSIQILYW